MRAKDIIIGHNYRHKTNPNYAWAKPLQILKPKEGINTNGYIVVKCEWSVDKNGSFGMIKYFKPYDLIKPI